MAPELSSSESEEGPDSEEDGLPLLESELSEHAHSTTSSDSDDDTPAIANPDISKKLLGEMLQTLEIKNETVTISKADKLLGVQKLSQSLTPSLKQLKQSGPNLKGALH